MIPALLIAATSVVSPPASDAEYTLALNPREPSVEVTLGTVGEEDGSTELAVDSSWGGISGHGLEITEISASGSSGGALEVQRLSDHSWSIAHPPGETLSVVYVLREPTDRTPLAGHNDYRTIVRPELFHMIGNLGLLHPTRLNGSAPRTYSVAWRGFDEEGWRTVSSFGHGPGPTTVTLPPDRFRHSLFIGGHIRIHERTMRLTRVAFAINDTRWGFSDEQFVELGTRIIASERSFFGDFTDPFFLVTLIPAAESGPGSFSLGGTGLTNCFALFCTPGMALGPGAPHDRQVKRLLAHEYFHTWIGGKVRIAAPEGAAYWFSEGFTDFYARRILLRSRLWTRDDFVTELNSTLSRYDASPVKDAPNDRIVAEFWKNREIADLPYVRGDLIALALDEKIREVSGGADSLDALVKDLYRRATAGEAALTTESLFDLIQARTTPEFATALRRAVMEGAPVPLPERVSEPRLALGTGTSRVYDLGFDFEASKASGRVTAVRDGSEAHRAGLRDGQGLKGYSITPGSGNRPPTAEITVEEDGAIRRIPFEPLSPPREVRQYKPGDR